MQFTQEEEEGAAEFAKSFAKMPNALDKVSIMGTLAKEGIKGVISGKVPAEFAIKGLCLYADMLQEVVKEQQKQIDRLTEKVMGK